jgi:hypothetical protein
MTPIQEKVGMGFVTPKIPLSKHTNQPLAFANIA